MCLVRQTEVNIKEALNKYHFEVCKKPEAALQYHKEIVKKLCPVL